MRARRSVAKMWEHVRLSQEDKENKENLPPENGQAPKVPEKKTPMRSRLQGGSQMCGITSFVDTHTHTHMCAHTHVLVIGLCSCGKAFLEPRDTMGLVLAL